MKLGCTQPGAYQFHIWPGRGRRVRPRTRAEGDTRYPEPKTYRVTVQPGRHALRFRCTPPPGFISADYRGLCYFIKDFKKTEVP